MLPNSSLKRIGVLTGAAVIVAFATSCTDLGGLPKHIQPLSHATKQLISDKGMDEESPIVIRIYKEDGALEVWKQKTDSRRYALLKSYDICKWSGTLGPKIREGDRQAPEGFYTVTPAQMNPNSSYHLAFNIGYPNDFDRANDRTGSFLMVHGACSSRGCYSMTDEQIQEIYTLARRAFEGGQRDFQVQAFPFHMTPENMARHRSDPNIEFWRMLKVGSDHFEALGQPPKVDVCAKRYVFNSVPVEGVTFSPAGDCPEMSVPDPIRVAVEQKQVKDDAKTRVITARLEMEVARKARRAPQSIANPEIMVAKAQPEQGSGAAEGYATASAASPSAQADAAAAPTPAGKPAEGAEAADIATAYTAEKPVEESSGGGFLKRLINKVF